MSVVDKARAVTASESRRLRIMVPKGVERVEARGTAAGWAVVFVMEDETEREHKVQTMEEAVSAATRLAGVVAQRKRGRRETKANHGD